MKKTEWESWKKSEGCDSDNVCNFRWLRLFVAKSSSMRSQNQKSWFAGFKLSDRQCCAARLREIASDGDVRC
jgi:hypothetical protein